MICAPLPESSFIILEIPNNALDSFLLVMGELINAIRSSVWYLESKEKLGFQVSEPYPNIHMPSPSCRSISSVRKRDSAAVLSRRFKLPTFAFRLVLGTTRRVMTTSRRVC